MSAVPLLLQPMVGGVRSGVLDDPPSVSDITPGWVALAIVVALCVVTALLWLNMRKQLGKIRFEE